MVNAVYITSNQHMHHLRVESVDSTAVYNSAELRSMQHVLYSMYYTDVAHACMTHGDSYSDSE